MRLPDARKLALELMDEHGLTQTGRAPEFGVRVWRCTFDNAGRRVGAGRERLQYPGPLLGAQ